MARFKFGDGRVGEVKFAADIEVGAPSSRGTFGAFLLEADNPALLRKGALEALGGQLDFARDVSAVRNHGVNFPLKVNEMGRRALSVVGFGTGPSCADRGPNLAESYCEWAVMEKRPDSSNGGLISLCRAAVSF